VSFRVGLLVEVVRRLDQIVDLGSHGGTSVSGVPGKATDWHGVPIGLTIAESP
jgi:hypothetical protein